MPSDWSPLWLSLRYAGVSTLLATLAALPLVWLMTRRDFRGRELLRASASLPLLLPPAVLLYYLLAATGRWELDFSWHRAVAVSAVSSAPLLLLMMRNSLDDVDPSFENAARGLGAGEWRTFWRITIPLAWRPLCAAVLACFMRAFVDFCATAMLATSNGLAWLWPLAAAGLAGIYVGNRIGRGQVRA